MVVEGGVAPTDRGLRSTATGGLKLRLGALPAGQGLSLRECGAGGAYLRERPGGNKSIYLLHQAVGLAKSNYDPHAMLDVIECEGATATVLEPLATDLVSTDLKLPDFRRDAFKILAVDFTLWVFLTDVDAPFGERPP